MGKGWLICKDGEGLVEGNLASRLVIIVIHRRLLLRVSIAAL